MKSSKRTLISAFAAILLITACDDDSSDNHGNSTDVSACTEITCGGHGKCAVTQDNTAVCICDNGYHTDPTNATSCILDAETPNACKDITCGDHGKCAVTQEGTSACICDNGYHTDPENAANCVIDAETPNACKDITCGGHGKCAVTLAGTAACICDNGYHTDPENAANCVVDSEEPNACKDITCGNHGKCAVTQEGTAACICDNGYQTDPENTANCIETPNACKDITCGGHGKCAITQDETALCICDDAFHTVPENAFNCVINDTIVFGHYEQDNDTTNGKEPITWRILDSNSSDQYLIISEKVLDVKRYNENYYNPITWEKSTIRSWLNGYDGSYNTVGKNYTSENFIDTAFAAAEKEKIINTDVPAHFHPDYSTSPGNATRDKIFLLSIVEARNYFTSSRDRQADATRYAVKHAASVVGSESGNLPTTNGTCSDIHCYASWWLRSPASSASRASGVTCDGSLTGNASVELDNVGVRPAMWVQF